MKASIQRTADRFRRFGGILTLFLATASVGGEALAGGYGSVQVVGSGTDEIWLVKVGGTRYEMGYNYGLLLADQVAGCMASVQAAFPIPPAMYDAVAASMWDPNFFDVAAYDQELQGIADGCAAGGHPEVTYELVRNMQLLPDISEVGCSLFAAWGSATADGHLYQLRNLDWEMNAGVQDFPVVAIFQPDDGQVHAVIGFAGSIGASGGGINISGIAQSQIMGWFCDPEPDPPHGVPFPIMLREMLYHDTTLAEGLLRIQNATRTNNYHYGISGPDGDEITGRLLLTSGTRCDVYADNESVDPHPCGITPFHTSFDDVVYWTRHNGSRNEEFYNAINDRYGSIGSAESIEIADIIQDAGGGTLMSIVYDATDKEFWVAYAEGTDPAPNQAFVHFELPTLQDVFEDYIAAPEPNYGYSRVRTISGMDYVGYVLDMTSLTWRDEPNEVDRELWQHWLTVIVPHTVDSSRALLRISGGNNGGDPPITVNSTLRDIAIATNTVVADLQMIPNQRIKFADEPNPAYQTTGRREDELIAYAWDKVLQTGGATWAPRLPMTKAAVLAMDTVQEYVSEVTEGAVNVADFVVSGESKRGWTAWTTAAMDPRVSAIIPLVIDILNVEASMKHHYEIYGSWSPALADYEEMGIMNWMDTPEFASLMALVDPYSYRDRYTMPKFIINSAQDEFFLPDSSQFYFDDLPGEKYLRYVPNTGHMLDGSDAFESLAAYYQAVLNGTPRPQFSWTLEPDGSIRVQTVDTPTEVKLWQATNPVSRDFRIYVLGPAYTDTVLTDQGGGVYVGMPVPPESGYTAFFVELTYPSGGDAPFKFTTEVRVLGEGNTLDLDIVNEVFGEVGVEPNAPAYYDANTVVTLTAGPNPNRSFIHWLVFDPNHPDDANLAVVDTNLVLTLTMDTDWHVEAAFSCGELGGHFYTGMVMVLTVGVWFARRTGRRR